MKESKKRNEGVRLSVRIDDKMNEALTEIADRFGLSKSVLVRKVMTEGLGQYAEHKGLSAEQYDEVRKQVLEAQQVLGDLETQIQRVGINLNQLTKLARSEGLDDDEEEELLQVLRDAKTEAEKARFHCAEYARRLWKFLDGDFRW